MRSPHNHQSVRGETFAHVENRFKIHNGRPGLTPCNRHRPLVTQAGGRLAKYDQIVTKRQIEFKQSQQTTEEKIQNLQDQISALESKMLTLRNLMASDYPHIKQKMSKYKFDYMESVDDILVQLKKVLTQTDTLLDQ